MFSIGEINGLSGSQEHDDMMCLTSISEEGQSYESEETFREETKKATFHEEARKGRRGLFRRKSKRNAHKSKNGGKRLVSDDEAEYDDDSYGSYDDQPPKKDDMPICVAEDFGFVTDNLGRTRFDYEGFQDDFAYIADTLFPGCRRLQTNDKGNKKTPGSSEKIMEAMEPNPFTNLASPSKSKRYVSDEVEFDVDLDTLNDKVDFEPNPSSVLGFVRTNLARCKTERQAQPEEGHVKKWKSNAKKVTCSSEEYVFRSSCTNIVQDEPHDVIIKENSTFHGRKNSRSPPSMNEVESTENHRKPKILMRVMSNLNFKQKKESDEMSCTSNMSKESRLTARKSSIGKHSKKKKSNASGKELGSIENRQYEEVKQPKRLMKASFKPKKEWDEISSASSKSKRNELKGILKTRSDSQSVSSIRSTRDTKSILKIRSDSQSVSSIRSNRDIFKSRAKSSDDRHSKARRFDTGCISLDGSIRSNASSVIISHRDGNRIIHSCVSVKQGLK